MSTVVDMESRFLEDVPTEVGDVLSWFSVEQPQGAPSGQLRDFAGRFLAAMHDDGAVLPEMHEELTPRTYLLDPYYISSGLTVLQGCTGVTRDEMARLEFHFINALDHSAHGIPNLERQLVESPQLFMQILALTFKRSDEGEDPPEWRIKDEEQRQAIFSASYTLLEKIKRIPGTQEDGKIDIVRLREWVTEVRSLCAQNARVEIGDQRTGQILAAAPQGDDGIWPCKPVRDVLEEIASPQIAIGMRVAVYNSRGAHARGEGGDQEREIAERFRSWARQLAFEYPYVADLIEQIAIGYDRDAVREDSETAVRRRLRR